MKNRYKQNDIVNFNIENALVGVGVVVGLDSSDVTGLGVDRYLIRVVFTEPGSIAIPSEFYQFDTIPISVDNLTCRL